MNVSSPHLTKSLSIGRHVSEDDEDVLLTLVGEVFSSGEGKTGGDDTLDGGVIGQVQEEAHILHGAILLKVLLVKVLGE